MPNIGRQRTLAWSRTRTWRPSRPSFGMALTRSTSGRALQHCRNPSAKAFMTRLSGSLKLLRAFGSGPSQARLCAHPLRRAVPTGFAPARVARCTLRLFQPRIRAHLGPLRRQPPEPCQSRPARHLHHLDEHPPELLRMAAARPADRAVPGKVPRSEHLKRHVLRRLPRDRARRERSRRAGMKRDFRRHRRLAGRVVAAIALAQLAECAQVRRIDQVADVTGRMRTC